MTQPKSPKPETRATAGSDESKDLRTAYEIHTLAQIIYGQFGMQGVPATPVPPGQETTPWTSPMGASEPLPWPVHARWNW